MTANEISQILQALKGQGLCFQKPETDGRVVSYLKELLKLGPAQLRGVLVTLEATLSSGTMTATDTYRVPSDQDLVVYGAQGSWRSTDMATEPVIGAAFATPTPSELLFVRTGNVLAKLENVDRSLQVMENRDIPLSAITPPSGAVGQWLAEAPLLIPATHTLKATFTAQDDTAGIIGNAAKYGLVLTGILIPKRV